jgi:transcriptional regulator with XRE-family HTH domain
LPLAAVRRLSEGISRVRVWPEHRGLALRQLAVQAGVSPSLLSEIESGKTAGSVHTLVKLARALGVAVDELLAVERRGNRTIGIGAAITKSRPAAAPQRPSRSNYPVDKAA